MKAEGRLIRITKLGVSVPSELVKTQSSQTHCWPETHRMKISRYERTSLCSDSDRQMHEMSDGCSSTKVPCCNGAEASW